MKKMFFRTYNILGVLAIMFLITTFFYRIADVSGTSMEPNFYEGDRVLVQKVINPKSLEPGDIVIFYADEVQSNVMHRIVSITPDGIMITKGDNNPGIDIGYRTIYDAKWKYVKTC